MNNNLKLQFLSYLFCGGLATVVDVGILFLLAETAGVPYLSAAAIAYLFGMITNFSLNKLITFQNRDPRYRQQAIKFFFVAMIGLAINQVILYILVEYFDIWYLYGKLFTLLVVVFWSFWGHKKITFGNPLQYRNNAHNSTENL